MIPVRVRGLVGGNFATTNTLQSLHVREVFKNKTIFGTKCVRRWIGYPHQLGPGTVVFYHKSALAKEPSAWQQGIFEQGKEVGLQGRRLYPGGELVDKGFTNPEGALAHTQQVIEAGNKTIFEAALLYENILVRVEILKKKQSGRLIRLD